MLTNIQIKELCGKMDIPLEACVFKSSLKDMKLKYNRSYIINMENEIGEDGKRNDGSHWVCFQVDKYKNGNIQGCYLTKSNIPCRCSVTFCCSLVKSVSVFTLASDTR